LGDTTPPSFELSKIKIRGVPAGGTGTFFDEGGIASIQALILNNFTLTIDPFSPGDKSVNFRLDRIDLTRPAAWSIEVTDVCGNVLVADPLFITLSTDLANGGLSFTFPSVERYFELTNHGLSEIQVDLNGNEFKLFSDPNRVRQEINSYYVPEEGIVTVDMLPYLREGDNQMTLLFKGMEGTYADLMLHNLDGNVDYLLDIQTAPINYYLDQNYPNPFNPTTTIRYSIPESITDAVPVQIQVYNAIGALVRTLVDEHKWAGQYEVQWDGRNQFGESVSSGIYVYRMVAGEFMVTKTTTLLK
jgi:hypothetical protein